MKTSLKIFLLAAALAVMTGCSAQRRAERHIRKAVALCPELVQVKAHPIDTVLTAPGFADATRVPLTKALSGETIYAATPHGTFAVSLSQPDSSLRVGFVAAPQKIHYSDNQQYSQVVIPESGVTRHSGNAWMVIGCILLGIIIGFVVLFWIALKAKIVE